MSADGIDVVLDIWSLKDGHDVNSFMEKMVTDSTIKRVIIVADAEYARKADARKGGVGTESQIISQEVYEKVDQEKFVPIVRERDEKGTPCLPVFLKSRKYLDFSDSDCESQQYDLLLRNIFERPEKRKPAIGKPPTYLYEDTAVSLPCAQKAKRFRGVVSSGKGNALAAFDDFTEEFYLNFNDLRLSFTQDQKDTWGDSVLGNLDRGIQYRDVCVDVVCVGSSQIQEQWFIEKLLAFLEQLLTFQVRPDNHGFFFKISEDNYKFLLYELFLYIIAALIKSHHYEDVNTLVNHNYVCSEHFDGERMESYSFSSFNNYVQTLEVDCNQDTRNTRISVSANKIVDRAIRNDIRLTDLIQADVICFLADFSQFPNVGWFPKTLFYSGRIGKCELFLRATSEQGIATLKTLISVPDAQGLISLLNSVQNNRSYQSLDFWRSDVDIHRLLNVEEIRRAWNLS